MAIRLCPDPTLTASAVQGLQGQSAAGGVGAGGSSEPSLGLNVLAKAALQVPNSGEWGWQVSPMGWICSETLTRSGLGEWSIHQGDATREVP